MSEEPMVDGGLTAEEEAELQRLLKQKQKERRLLIHVLAKCQTQIFETYDKSQLIQQLNYRVLEGNTGLMRMHDDTLRDQYVGFLLKMLAPVAATAAQDMSPSMRWSFIVADASLRAPDWKDPKE